jgi:hypothetical protein
LRILILSIVCLLSVLRETRADQIYPSDASVSLLTFGPGRHIYERFGHNAIRVRVPSQSFDVCFDWGRFDFESANFVANFVHGRMVYSMGGDPGDLVVPYYIETLDRTVIEQELDLTPQQIARLIDDLQRQNTDANRNYRYDYYADNCSTRVRDALDRAVGGQITRASTASTSTTLRWHTRRLGPVGIDNKVISAGIDLVTGRPVDRSISLWEHMFLPTELSRSLDALKVDGRPLVKRRTELNRTTTPAHAEPDAPARLWLIGLVVGVVGAATLWVSRGRGGLFRLLAGAWSAFGAVAAGVIIYLWFFTDHVAARGNENLLLFTPVSLVVMAGLLVSRWHRAAVRAAQAVVLLAGVGLIAKLLPSGGQENWPWIFLSLPLHAAVWQGMLRRTVPASADAMKSKEG